MSFLESELEYLVEISVLLDPPLLPALGLGPPVAAADGRELLLVVGPLTGDKDLS